MTKGRQAGYQSMRKIYSREENNYERCAKGGSIHGSSECQQALEYSLSEGFSRYSTALILLT